MLLAMMHAEGLPVPKPIAARVQHQGLFYRGDILIERFADAIPLYLEGKSVDSVWLQVVFKAGAHDEHE